MRASLKQSIADSPVRNFERYPAGSIVLCNACAKPIYKLERGCDVGMKAGRAAQLFKPISLADLMELEGRGDVDAGMRAAIANWTPEQRRAHLQSLTEPKSGDPMICPVCAGCFVQVLSIDKNETLDRAFVIELLTVPPLGVRPSPIRGKTFDGERGDWIHERKH